MERYWQWFSEQVVLRSFEIWVAGVWRVIAGDFMACFANSFYERVRVEFDACVLRVEAFCSKSDVHGFLRKWRAYKCDVRFTFFSPGMGILAWRRLFFLRVNRLFHHHLGLLV